MALRGSRCTEGSQRWLGARGVMDRIDISYTRGQVAEQVVVTSRRAADRRLLSQFIEDR